MTTLADRPKTALVVVDVQNGIVGGAFERDRVVANVAALVAKARSAGVAVVWVQHHGDDLVRGSAEWQWVPELVPAPDEPLVEKAFADAFEATTLEHVLAGLGAGQLVLAGAQTDECIRATLHGSIVRGYDALLVADAHTTEDLSEYGAPPPALVISHTNLYWDNHRAPGRTAGTVATAEVDFAALSG